ncbi:MAG TPA: sigma-70 family RNA polymerase sigma factor [Terriglobales bacterium]|nr:sigma-70 family RNA polymerase sigma factor [Terriglobales bacterium]
MNSNTNSTATLPLSPDVIRRAQQGDSDAFSSLFHAHKSRIYSLCLRMTNNPAEAEDLAQDAFLQVFRKLSSFRGDSELSTWLYRITVNTVLMHFRKKSLVQVSLDEPYTTKNDNAKQVRREYGTKDDRLVGSITRVALTRAISELPEGYRTIFLLHEVEGYEHQEIAELLGCSVGNSKSQLHKAKLKIRDFLACPPETRAETRRNGRPGSSRAKSVPSLPMVEKWRMPMPPVPCVNNVLPFAQPNA